MSKKFSIKEMKSPDKFFKSMVSFVGYLKHNVKLYLILSSVVVAITAAVAIVNYVNDTRQEKAKAEFYRVSKQIQMLNTNDVTVPIKLIEDVLGKLGNTDAGMEASYMLAELYYNNKNWDTAIKYYEKVSGNAKGLLNELSLLGLAYSKESKGDTQGALDAFNKVKDIKSSAYSPIAAMGTGRCFQKLGDKSKAIAAYEAIIIAYPDTDYAKQASTAKASL